MRLNNFFLMGIIALGFVACKNDQVPDVSGETAKVEIRLAGTPVQNGARATGAALPTTTAENSLSRVTVGIFNSDGTVNVIRDLTTAEITGALATTPAEVLCRPATGAEVIVVANAPAGHFAGMTTRANFVARTVALSTTATLDVQDGNNLPMAGRQTGITLTAGTRTPTTVNISRLVARVAINSIRTNFDAGGQYANATFTLTRVFMHNANSASTVDPANVAGSVPISGQTANPYLFNAVANQAITSTAYTTLYWFYTFANSSAATPTRLVLQGQFDADGAGAGAATTVYYPITINRVQLGTTITGTTGTANGNVVANNTYLLSAVIRGAGVPNPDDDTRPAILELTITVADWALNITQAVEFN